MPKQSSKWTMTVFHEENGTLQVRFEGPANKAKDMHALEAAIRGLRSWDIEPHFVDGKAPKTMKRDWLMPIKRIAAKMNPGNGKKKKSKGSKTTDEDAIDLYRRFNGTDPNDIKHEQVWLPDESSPLVALGEGFCPFVGYSSAKTNTKGEEDKYIHHFGEEGGKKPRLYVTCPPPGYQRMLVIYGGDWDIEERGDGLLWLVN